MVGGKLLLAAGALALAASAPAGAGQAARNGAGISAASATVGRVDFDPPGAFADSLPLKGFYLNPKTRISVTAGSPGLLDASAAAFGVTGFSPPNVLAFDCTSRNADGSVPRLPMEPRFSSPVAFVSMTVGSLADAGAKVTLAAFNAKGAQVARSSVLAAAAMQRISVGVKALAITSARLTGPCVLVVDDVRALTPAME